jgi:hypothetical protein
MLHPYTIFFEELWRESERRLPDDDPADDEPTSDDPTSDDPADDGPTTATDPRGAHPRRWRAVVRFRHRQTRRSPREAAG